MATGRDLQDLNCSVPRHRLSLLICPCEPPHDNEPLGTLALPALSWPPHPGDGIGVPPPGSSQMGAGILPH